MNIRTILLGFTVIAGLGLSSLVATADDVETSFDKKPVPTRTPQPSLPPQLSDATGIVLVTIVIDERGNVAEATVDKSTNAALDAPSLQAVKGWKFTPAEKDGQVVKARIKIPLHYSS